MGEPISFHYGHDEDNDNQNSGGMSSSATNSTDSMDMNQHQMASAFSEWSVYELNVLFNTWAVTNRWQFALTWFAICFAVIFYHFLDCAIACFKRAMNDYLYPLSISKHSESENTIRRRPPRPVGWQVVNFLYSALCALKYGLSLMLMLIAMTFNPSIFLALVVGYLIGNFVFCDFYIDVQILDWKEEVFWTTRFFGKLIQKLLLQRAPPATVEESQSSNASSHTIYMEKTSSSTPSPSSKIFSSILWLLPRALSVIFLILTFIWVVDVEGGFSFDIYGLFGYHAILMAFFVSTCMTEGLLTYVAPVIPQLANDRSYLKYFHSFCHVAGLTCMVLGLVAIVQWKWMAKYPNDFPMAAMYSPHSWLGVCTVVLWFLQLFYGLVVFLLVPCIDQTFRADKSLVEIHRFLGHTVYAFGLATCALGFQDMQSSDLAEAYQDVHSDGSNSSPDGYGVRSRDSNLASAAAIVLAFLGVSTFAALRFLAKEAKS